MPKHSKKPATVSLPKVTDKRIYLSDMPFEIREEGIHRKLDEKDISKNNAVKKAWELYNEKDPVNKKDFDHLRNKEKEYMNRMLVKILGSYWRMLGQNGPDWHDYELVQYLREYHNLRKKYFG